MIKSLNEIKNGMVIKDVMTYVIAKNFMYEKNTDTSDFPMDCDYAIDIITRYVGRMEYHKTIAIKNGIVVGKWNWKY